MTLKNIMEGGGGGGGGAMCSCSNKMRSPVGIPHFRTELTSVVSKSHFYSFVGQAILGLFVFIQTTRPSFKLLQNQKLLSFPLLSKNCIFFAER
jgi:hypothetical protein